MAKSLAIIPARGGSKRIPRKNLKSFYGKPILAYAIEKCLQTQLFHEVMVSTDDQEIAGVAHDHGAKIPFMRSTTNSNDFAGTIDVLKEVVTAYAQKGQNFEYFLCLYPTTPLLKAETLVSAWENFLLSGYDFFISVNRYTHPIQRALRSQDQQIQMIDPTQYSKRTQDLATTYYDAGQFYFGRVANLLRAQTLLDGKTGFYELSPWESQDIDCEDDWKMAELKYQLSRG